MHEPTASHIWSQRALSITRIVVALLMIEHGTQKAFAYPSLGMERVPLNTLMGAAAIIEIIGGCFFLVGLLTRLAAFVLCGEMAFAYFIVHAPHGPFPLVNQGEPAVLFCFIFLYYIFAGGGAWSLDALIERHESRKHPVRVNTRQTVMPKS